MSQAQPHPYSQLSKMSFYRSLKVGKKDMDQITTEDFNQRNSFASEKDQTLLDQFWDNRSLFLMEYGRLLYMQNIQVYLASQDLKSIGVSLRHRRSLYESGLVVNLMKAENQLGTAQIMNANYYRICASLQGETYSQEKQDKMNQMKMLGGRQAVLHLREPIITKEFVESARKFFVDPLPVSVFNALNMKP